MKPNNNTKKYIEDLVKKINKTLLSVKDKEIDNFIDAILNAKNVFIYGVGRSGLVAKSFATRLSHLNINVYMIGDTINRPVEKTDLFIAISGSGNTKSVVVACNTAKKIGCEISIITANKESKLYEIADNSILINTKTKDDDKLREYITNQLIGNEEIISPMGTIFEISCFVLLDAIIEDLILLTKNTEQSMKQRHANIE